jgi:hypothetical protein
LLGKKIAPLAFFAIKKLNASFTKVFITLKTVVFLTQRAQNFLFHADLAD